MSDDWVMIICFGEVEISDARITGNVSQPESGPNTAELVIPNDLLMAATPDYQATVQIFACRGTERHARFAGYVDRVSLERGSTRINCVSQSQFASEVALGGFGYRNVNPLEVIWAMARFTGFAPEDITIEGWEPGPVETFEVATAIDGISIDEPVALGRVTLLPDGPVARLADGMQQAMLRSRYAEGPVWALVFPTARTLLEADAEGVREIDLALAWLSARTRYSSVALPGGRSPLSFRRHWTLSHVHQRDVVVARGLSTNRRWIRAQQGMPSRPELVLDEIDDLALPALPDELPVEVAVAVSAWHRAAEASDPVEATLALWEAIEFYASGTKVERLFTSSERKTIRENATKGLSADKKHRVEEVLERMLNQAPLMVRLREALKEDEVPCANGELSVLQRVLKKRSDLHGRSREAPSESDLRYAVALVNRMLVYRVARSNEANEGRHAENAEWE